MITNENNIYSISSTIKTYLLKNDNIVERITTDKYIILMEKLQSIFQNSSQNFTISNDTIKQIILYGDIKKHNIMIYLNDEHYGKWDFLMNEDIIEKSKNHIKMSLKLREEEYILHINKRRVEYNYYFTINQLEYDIKKNVIINIQSKKQYDIYDEYINKLQNLNLIDEIDKNEIFTTFLSKNPLIIFELFELLLEYYECITNTEIKYFFLNLNTLMLKKEPFRDTLKETFRQDINFVIYRELYKFSQILEEKGIFKIYLDYLLNNHNKFIKKMSNIKVDMKLYEIFDIHTLKEYICLIIFQHLIYGKRTIFKQKKILVKDLLDTFLSQHYDDSEFSQFDMLDKDKIHSLKYLKECNNNFIKFEGIIKMFSLPIEDEIYIKTFYNIFMLLYTDLKDIRKHHNLKLGYIIKRFHFTKRDLLIKIINIYNSIIKYKEFEDVFMIHDNFIDIITSKILNDYIYKKMTTIPKINETFKANLDCIDIIDFQDTFILFIEFIYKNKHIYTENEPELLEWFETVFNASLCDMRSYRIFKNEKRRKQEKNIKREKQVKKEMKKKYKIIKKSISSTVEENDEPIDNVEEPIDNIEELTYNVEEPIDNIEELTDNVEELIDSLNNE
jgi:hypothetical protein